MVRESILRSSQHTRVRRALEKELVELASASGYVEIETPTLEKATGSPSENYHSLHVSRGSGQGDLVLRSDLTPALVGFLATNAVNDASPLRLVQVGPVWRGERAQYGRFRESRHFDADVVSKQVGVEDAAEALALAVRCASKWDGSARFRVSHTHLHRLILEALGVPSIDDLHGRAMRFLRRRPRDVGRDELVQGLINAGLSFDISDGIAHFSTLESVHEAAIFMKSIGADIDVLDELAELVMLLADLGVTSGQVVTDFAMTGIGYYDGIVFAHLTPSIGETPMIEGGSYLFPGNDEPVSGVGFSLDLDRIAAFLCARESST